jgi:hypothetical protein
MTRRSATAAGFAFAHRGKGRHTVPVARDTCDRTIEMLNGTLTTIAVKGSARTRCEG